MKISDFLRTNNILYNYLRIVCILYRGIRPKTLYIIYVSIYYMDNMFVDIGYNWTIAIKINYDLTRRK